MNTVDKVVLRKKVVPRPSNIITPKDYPKFPSKASLAPSDSTKIFSSATKTRSPQKKSELIGRALSKDSLSFQVLPSIQKNLLPGMLKPKKKPINLSSTGSQPFRVSSALRLKTGTKEINDSEILASINFEKPETPKKRSSSEVRPPYSETLSISQFIPSKTSKLEFSKGISLDIYDPVLDPLTPKGLLDQYKQTTPRLTGYSKWFFGNGTYEWRSCTIEAFNKEEEKFLIVWPNGNKKHVTRINLRFEDENEKEFEDRIAEARRNREDMEVILRYNAYLLKYQRNVPDFPTSIAKRILKFLAGRNKVRLDRYRDAFVYAKLPLDERFNHKKSLWKNFFTHIEDETELAKLQNFASHSDFFNHFLLNVPEFRLFAYKKAGFGVNKKQMIINMHEVQKNWKLALKNLCFKMQNKSAIESSVLSASIIHKAAYESAIVPYVPPKLTSHRFMSVFSDLRKNSFFINPESITILQEANKTLLNLKEFSLFPEIPLKKVSLEEFISLYSKFSDNYFYQTVNSIYDVQSDITEILTLEDLKRLQRNELKTKERIHSKQIIELEEALPPVLISFITRLIKVSNMKFEDIARISLRTSLDFLCQEFKNGKEIIECKASKDLRADDLEYIKNQGSNFLSIELTIDKEKQKVVPFPATEVIKTKTFGLVQQILSRFSKIKCISAQQTGPARQNGFLKILEIDSEGYLNIIKTLEENLDFQFKLLYLLIARLEPYYFIITLNPAVVSENFKKRTNDEIDNEIYKMKRNEIEITEILAPVNCNFGIWNIGVSKLKASLINSLEKTIEALFQLLVEDSERKLDEINGQYNEVNSSINFVPSNVEQLDDIRKFIKLNFASKIEFIEEHMRCIDSSIDILEGYRFHISYELYEKCWRCMAYSVELEEIKLKSLETANDLIHTFTIQIISQKESLCKEIEIMGEKLAVLKLESDIKNQDTLSLDFTFLKAELDKATSDAKLVNSRELIMEREMTDFKMLDDIKREFTPYCKLWFFIRDFLERQPKWMTEPISTIQRDLIASEVNLYLTEVSKMEKNSFKDNPHALVLTKDFLDMVIEFKPYVPVIKAFNNPGLKERHWTDIETKCGIKYNDNKVASLKYLIDNKIMENLELLESTSDLASKEQSLENAKKKMDGEWSSAMFEFQEFKGSHILLNTDTVFDMINEHILRTTAMMTSPFIGFIMPEMHSWKANLIKMQEVLDNWEKFQRNWMYLQPIFASQDISNQLHQAANKFRSINSQWESIMSSTYKTRNIYECCLGQPKLLDTFIYCNESLDMIIKNLNEYLQAKRKAFPRFYFLSNDELMSILSNSQDLISIQKYIIKCFEGIITVIIEDKKIVGMTSPEGEKVRFNNAVEFYIGQQIKSIELWMVDIEKEMMNCLRDQLANAIKDFSMDLKAWVSHWPSQLILASLTTIWTNSVEESINQNTLPELLKKQEQKIGMLVDAVRSGLTGLTRLTFSTMVVLDVHNKDIIETLVGRNIQKADEFSWFSNMRFYFVNNALEIRMLDSTQFYGYEYLGNQNRLVITALTDRCYMTLMSALNMSLGGAPEGPAGTGKTETVKDLAKGIAKKCVVFNCSDKLDTVYMAKFFTGLCCCGAWACFDEFNRIELEVLSVIAEQILSIQMAVQKKQPAFSLDGDEVKLNLSVAVFITMNPDYAGRSKLPDNLKALFRPMAMMVPDYAMIAEIFLYSFGFGEARNLSKKITNSLKLASEQLSSQPHYDYGMRAVSTILRAAGMFKQTDSSLSEELLVLKAIKYTNIPKFLGRDIPLFNGILADLFPGVVDDDLQDPNLLDSIKKAIVDLKLVENPKFIEKVFEIFRTVRIRHGLMIVGETMAGKTCALHTLAKALSYDKIVELLFINPKGLKVEQLYGDADAISQDWKDGILTLSMRKFCEKIIDGYQWIILDGPVDAVWIESMNTVMDDNKKLCLASGEIIKLNSTIRMLFEVDDLSQASPATVSRCGMIYMNPEDILGPGPLINAWITYPPFGLTTPMHKALFEKLFSKIFLPCLENWSSNIRNNAPIALSRAQVTKNMIQLLQSFILKKNKSRAQHDSEGQEEYQLMLESAQAEDEEEQIVVKIKLPTAEEIKKETEKISNLFVMAVFWCFGGASDEVGRGLVSQFLCSICKDLVNVPDNIQNYFYNDQEKKWCSWNSILIVPSRESSLQNLLVPTTSLVSYTFLLNELLTRKESILIIGETATGKTSLINSVLQKIDKVYSISSTLFSAKTGSNEVQTFVEGQVVKRRKGYYGPVPGKFKIMFIDDLSMPSKEQFGAQPAIEFLRSLMERGYIFDRVNLEVKHLEDIQFIGCMASSGRNKIPVRFISKSFLLNFVNYDPDSLFLILNTTCIIGLSSYATQIQDLAESLTYAIIKVYTEIALLLPPTPTKSHYTFSFRDLSNVLKGIFLVPPSKLTNVQTLYRLWVNECFRVFSDRFIVDSDTEILAELLKDTMKTVLKVKWEKVIEHDPVFVNILDDRMYQECNNPAKIKQCLENYLEDYNNEHTVEMNLLMFDYAIKHITRIARVLAWNSGNLLLIGVGGSGRMSLTKLCTYLLKMIVFQIKITKTYGMLEWTEDIRNLLRSTGIDDKKIVFILRDSEIILETFLETINNILNSGQAPGLFSADETQAVIEIMKSNKNYSTMNELQRWEAFTQNIMKNLHIVICMFPQGEVMRTRLRQYPSLVNCCTIDWFREWPEQALAKVAEVFINEEKFIEDTVKISAAVKIFVNFHLTVRDLSQVYLQEYKRYNYVTPTHYVLLLKNVKNLYKFKEDTTIKLTNKYSSGVQQLDNTHMLVQKLKEDLTALKPVLERKTILADETLKQIQEENAEADITRGLVAAEQVACEEQAALAESIKKECEITLSKTLPELDAAIKALDTIKREDINLVKSMNNPPEAVKLTLEAVAIANRKKPVKVKDPTTPGVILSDYYESGKKLLSIPRFIQTLKSYDRDSLDDEVISKIEPYIKLPKFHPDVVKYASSAAEGMCKWVRAMYNFYHVNNDIKPKKKALEEAQGIVKEKTMILKQKKAELARIEEYIESLGRKLEVQIKEKNDLIEQIHGVEVKMNRAITLIDQLSEEKINWKGKVTELSSDLENLLGDILLSAAVVTYLGPFILSYRETALHQKWMPFISSFGLIPFTPKFSLVGSVGEAATLQNWIMCGLPSDKISLENSLIIHHTLNWPLIVDPQGQASKWLKKMFSELNLTTFRVKLENSDFMSTLENALFLGAIFIIEDLKESIDPVLDPLIMKEWYKQDSMTVVKIGDQAKQIDPAFKMYMLSNYSNPRFPPEVSTKVTLLNFTITEEGLSEQLLDLVCRKEMPKETHERDQLIMQSAEYKRNMQAFEDTILLMLKNGGATILDNEELIDSLTKSKMLSIEVGKKLILAKKAEEKIISIQSSYVPVCKLSSILYFCVADLCNIDFMYQFSMEWFLGIYQNGVTQAEKCRDLNERVKNIIHKVREILFTGIYPSLQEEDKLLFTLLISVRLQMHEGHVEDWQWKFFLTGLCGIGESQENPTSFLNEKSWREVLQLNQKLPGFKEDLMQDPEKWKKFLCNGKTYTTLPSFEELSKTLPAPYNTGNLMNRLLIMRCVKPEIVGLAVKSYIKSILGEKFLHPVVFSIQNIYKETSPLRPLIFILTGGTDPQGIIKNYTTENGFTLVTVSLGKGQGERAEKIIQDASADGRWVLLQNCHLAVSWLPRLELLFEKLAADPTKLNHNFRLTLTAAPTDGFPVGILRKSMKAASQLPTGLCNSLLGMYTSIKESKEESAFYESSSKPEYWKKLFFTLSFFHCVIRERRAFGPIGWNVKYEFSESDFKISSKQLMQMINQFPTPPFEALVYLTAECNYGGKVTDDYDRRTLKCMLQSFYMPEVIYDSRHRIVPVKGYQLPKDLELGNILSSISTFPQVQSAEIFGLHPNAEISRSRKETYELCGRLLALQPQAVNSSFEEQKKSINLLVGMFLPMISSKFDVKAATQKYPFSYYDSMNTVLVQELNRYNRLIDVVTNSLINIRKVYEGTILITEEYEVLSQSLLKNKVPELWMKISYSSCKTLISYIEDLKKRIEFFNEWIDKGKPAVFWISGFYFTQSFLTACLQEFARRQQLPIDTLIFSSEVINQMPTMQPEYGAYINGLYLEGASWDGASLQESKPGAIFYEFPVIWLKPTNNKLNEEGMFKCPIYRTLIRAGSVSTTGHSTNYIFFVLLKTVLQAVHWIKRGVGLFAQLDD